MAYNRSSIAARPDRAIPEVEAFSRLHEISDCCGRPGTDFDGCLGAILDAAIYFTAADKGNLQLIDSESCALVISAQRGFDRQFLDFFSQVRAEPGSACGAALQAVSRVTVEDVARSELFTGETSLDVLLAGDVRAVQSTPLISSSGCLRGMISTHFTRPTRLREREFRFTDLLARQAADYLERKESDRRLEAKQLQLDRIASRIGSLVSQCSRDFRYVFVNGPFAEFIRKPSEQIVGRFIPTVIGEAAFRVMRPYIDRVLEGHRVEYEAEIPYADLGPRYVHVVYAPDVDPQGAVCGWVATINDITERKRREQHLVTADRHKDEFLAMLAHELRNPLAPIRYALAAAKRSGSPEHQLRAQEIIDRQVGHMARLLDDLLDVSRITRGKLELQRSCVELTSILADAIEAARPALDSRGHNVSLDLQEELGRLEGDSVRLTQVFANLLINAAKYTDPGGRIELHARRESGEAVVSVRDNGMGISKELAPRLFTFFTQGNRALDRAQGGLGVGLALVRGIVELHGGRVEVSSDGPNHGSEFIVRLPLAPMTESPLVQLEEATGTARSTLRILIADDNRDVADTCATLLALSGHLVRTAYNGRGALDIAEGFAPHVCLLDIGMPDMDGYELAERIRAAAWGKYAVLVAVSGWGREEDRTRACSAGFDHHLTKPLPGAALEAFLESVAGALGSSVSGEGPGPSG